MVLESARLRLRPLTDAEVAPWVALFTHPDVMQFVSPVPLSRERAEAAFTPAIEIGWDVLPEYWGKGYATEGARAALDYAFTSLKLEEVVAITAAGNVRSQRVMERLGMSHDPNDDFNHPHFADGPFRRALLFRIKRPPSSGPSRGSG